MRKTLLVVLVGSFIFSSAAIASMQDEYEVKQCSQLELQADQFEALELSASVTPDAVASTHDAEHDFMIASAQAVVKIARQTQDFDRQSVYSERTIGHNQNKPVLPRYKPHITNA